MSDQGEFDADNAQRNYHTPYTSRHPIPTVQKYREQKSERDERQKRTEAAQHDEQDDSTTKRAFHAAKNVVKGDDPPQSSHEPYPAANRNVENQAQSEQREDEQPTQNGHDSRESRGDDQKEKGVDHGKDTKQEKSATETVAGKSDPREKRKDMKKMKRDDGGREVTDPVTHLPIVIHDATHKDLHSAPENEPITGSEPRTMTGPSGAGKDDKERDSEQRELQAVHHGFQKLFPPPNFKDAKAELVKTYQLALTVGLGTTVALATLAVLFVQVFDLRLIRGRRQETWQWSVGPILLVTGLVSAAGFAVVGALRGWLGKKVEEVWEDEVWDAAREEEKKSHDVKAIMPESVAWLNSLLASIWPLINPDLFTSISDMLEDVMQASLPKVVRMVSVDDLGQGNEAIRILGIKWLPTGAASQSVDDEGNLKSAKDSQDDSDRLAPGQGQQENADDQDQDGNDKELSEDEKKNKEDEKAKEQEKQAMREGMEAEQGDFVNLELAFAYRARSTGKSLKTKAKNAHLYLRFYLPGGIAIPVWVELRGIIGKMRLRLQLTPDPPFFSLCTLTFLGQPQADLSCVPLSKHSLNLMDVPLISSFVQSSIDAALAEYVAPKSLTLDLKNMLVGDDFKKDTVTRGVVIIYIKSARDFKEGDGGIGPFKGTSDSYVTVSWGKFGKPVASTRVISEDQCPNWDEWSNILVSPEELNADEKLRLQLWDSDKMTADDDLGRVEVDIRELMHNPQTQNKMHDREDRFTAEDTEEKMPGSIKWSVGYFAKLPITSDQLSRQTEDPDIKTVEDLKAKVKKSAENKLREATPHDESKELKQQTQQDFKEREDALIISAPPPDDYASGILSIQIHNITGLEVEKLQKASDGSDGREDEAEHSDELPSSYASIILNHQRIYRTRTKPKNAKPFFNAGTERFLRDWRTTEIMISVRDDREREDDALLGMVYLPLNKVFAKRSQVMQSYPLVGGIGYGRIRVSMVWRTVELKLPQELLGWDYGTLEVKSPVKWKSGNGQAEEVNEHRIKLRTNLMSAKMSPGSSKDGGSGHDEWVLKREKESVFLAVRKRYSSCLTVAFRKSTLGSASTTAFGVLWLKDIPDEEDKTVTLEIWKSSKDALKRATSSCNYKGNVSKENENAAAERPLGELELNLKFWRGLSGYHKKFAEKGDNHNVRDVMEVLDTANDEKEIDTGEEGDSDDSSANDSDASGEENSGSGAARKKLKTHTNQDSSGSELDGDGESKSKNPLKKVKEKVGDMVDGHNDSDDGSRGVKGQLLDYKDHHKQLHRKHRGVMQWKGARTMDWMAGKVKRAGGRVGEVFEHSDKDQGVETEV